MDDSHRSPFAKKVQAAFIFVYFWCCFRFYILFLISRFYILFSKSVIYSSIINFVDIGNKNNSPFFGQRKKNARKVFLVRVLLLGYNH